MIVKGAIGVINSRTSVTSGSTYTPTHQNFNDNNNKISYILWFDLCSIFSETNWCRCTTTDHMILLWFQACDWDCHCPGALAEKLPGMYSNSQAGIILHMHPANERRHYIVTSSLIGWEHTQNDPCPGRAVSIKLMSSLCLNNQNISHVIEQVHLFVGMVLRFYFLNW